MPAHILWVENSPFRDLSAIEVLSTIGIDTSLYPYNREALVRLHRGPRPDLILLHGKSLDPEDSEIERYIFSISRMSRIPVARRKAERASTPATGCSEDIIDISKDLPPRDLAMALRIIIDASHAAIWMRTIEFGPLHILAAEHLLQTLSVHLPNTAQHCQRVARLAIRVARRMGLAEVDCQKTYASALLHDIGKAGIRRKILMHPGPLASHEFCMVQQHVQLSRLILKHGEFPVSIIRGVLHHHENFDGSGYPAGIAEQSINLPARIIRVADAFDAMTARRPYRPARSPRQAIAELEYCAGSDFDPRVVGAIAELIREESASSSEAHDRRQPIIPSPADAPTGCLCTV